MRSPGRRGSHRASVFASVAVGSLALTALVVPRAEPAGEPPAAILRHASPTAVTLGEPVPSLAKWATVVTGPKAFVPAASTTTARLAPTAPTTSQAPDGGTHSGGADVPPAAPPPAPPVTTPGADPARLLFGIGSEADGAVRTRLYNEAPVRMLTSWYNGPNDLAWMTGWRGNLVPEQYAAGNALHLIVFSDVPEGPIDTAYGPACGRPYPLSDRFVDDMRQLAETFAGPAEGPPLYVTLFTEVQTYACVDNSWNADSASNAYWRALKDQYRAALDVFHATAPNAQVSLGWGGWQTRWDDPAIGGGRSMFGHFADVLEASDFQSFQAMQSDTNVADIREMTATLGAYGKVMLAHYKPDNGSQSTFDADVRAVLTDAYLRDVQRLGLFAMSFMDEVNLDASEATFGFVAEAVRRHAG